MMPKFLRPEVLPYASVEIVRVDGRVELLVSAKTVTTLVPITVPDRFRDLPMADSTRPCDVCGLRASFHYDGWDGNYLGCHEACARRGFHALLADPATGPKLDAALAECAAIDARLAEDDRLDAEREGDGNQCGPNCSFCGRCS